MRASANDSSSPSSLFSLVVVLLLLLTNSVNQTNGSDFTISEATIDEIQKAFAEAKLTSTQLVDFYLERIQSYNPLLRSVLEINPDARCQAEEADRERRRDPVRASSLGALHGIPVLLKDSIATKDKLNNTAGSYALVGSEVAREAHVVEKLRRAGAIIMGKASLSEWYGTRSNNAPSNWCARGGLALNPYVEREDPCGSSYGSAISVASNMVAVSVATETHGSIILPADHNSVVGFKPTVGLTSRASVIPISPRQDTVGPICRTVSDAVHVLDVIAGFDPRDYEATHTAQKFIPKGGYKQFLKNNGLKGKRIGVMRKRYSSSIISVFDSHLQVMRERGATVIDNLEIANMSIIENRQKSGEMVATLAEFKLSINKYLQEEFISSPVRSLADIIQFNIHHPDLEKTEEYGQDLLIASEKTNGIGKKEVEAIKRMDELSKNGFEEVMKENELDAIVSLGGGSIAMLAIGGYPAITVPAGYDYDHFGKPFGICFGGLKGSEPTLIQIAYDFEQSTMVRKPPISFASNFHSKLQHVELR